VSNNSNSNRLISLAGVVAVEAWYERFKEDCKETDFFLHVKFQDGLFGASPEHPVRFKIRLKNANVSIVPEEPLKVPRKHVRRDRIEVEARRVTESRLAGSGHADAARIEGEKSDLTTVSQVSHSGMTIEHSTDDQGYNSWSFAPIAGPHLKGQAFNETEPLLKVKHEGDLSKIPPVVKVHVSCLREDIDIIDLEVKEPKQSFLHRGMGEEQKLKLVEEMIKESLVEGGLMFEGEMDKVSKVQIADVIAAEE